VERAEIHAVGEHLMPQIDVLERQSAHFGRGWISALIILEPAERRIALVVFRAVEVIGEPAQTGLVVASKQPFDVAAKVDEPRVVNSHRSVINVEARKVPGRTGVALLESVVRLRVPVDATGTLLLVVGAARAP